MISTTIGDQDTLSIRFHDDGTPVNRFLRVDTLVAFSKIQFQLFDAQDRQLIVEQMAVKKAERRCYSFTKSESNVYDVVVIDRPQSGGTFRYHIESATLCGTPGYLQFTKADTNTVNIQTVLTKWTTPPDFINTIVPSLQQSGYNMVHMVPIQERGLSDSPYSIRDQLRLSKDFDDDQRPPEVVLRSMIDAAKNAGIRSMVDVVWNHTACDTRWLLDHPEAGYTIDTAPHLKAALEVDEAMLMFSQRLDQDSGRIDCEADLERICGEFAAVLEECKLEEYFLLHIQCHLDAFHPTSTKNVTVGKEMVLNVIQDGSYDRFSHHLNMDLVNQYYHQLGDLQDALHAINSERQKLVDDIKTSIITNTKARVRYERLAADGPRLGPVCASQPLLSPYFTRLFPPHDTHKKPIAFANNGWVWDADPLVNFADAPGLAYLRRDIIIWGDCVKLRYGTKPADCPWLWEHMATYTRQMASLFDGIRIDNCHSTPLPVAKYLLGEARAVNPQLYVVAELFTGRPDRDELFVGELALDSLIREAMQCSDPADLARSLNRFAGSSGVTTCPHALLMDCTHDNPAPAQKRTVEDAFTTAAIVAMAPCAVGSVRGFDHLVPEHLNIVFEQRHYQLYDVATPIEHIKKIIMDLKNSFGGDWRIMANEKDGLVTVTATPVDYGKEYVLLAKTVFTPHEHQVVYQPPADLKILFAGRIHVDHNFKHNNDRITGYNSRIEPIVNITELNPGSVVLFEMPTTTCQSAIDAFYNDTDNFACFASLSIADLNMLLYRTDAEERDMQPPFGVYVVPDFGPLPYCGIAGFVLPIMQNSFGIMHHSDPFTNNAINGTWMLDYTLDRLRARSFDAGVVDCLTRLFELIKAGSGVERARETLRAFGHLYDLCLIRAKQLLNADNELDLNLAIGLVQMYGQVQSTGYHPSEATCSLAAGLPHFATHHMRCWGRDTFTAYKGFFLKSKRLEEGKEVIKAFASCLYHGLVPNLLDARRFPRFNSRDAVWWFVYAVVEHARMDRSILEESVEMRFPNDIYTDYNEWLSVEDRQWMTVADIVKEVYKQHARGIAFREFNAGAQLDAHMKEDGFNVSIHVDWTTGLIHGGNIDNCGTWMDKMGHVYSVNEGVPATPRNGANVEINALCLYSMQSLLSLVGDFAVIDGKRLSEWEGLLRGSFDSVFFDTSIKCYKDVHDKTEVRPNFLIATALLDLPMEHIQQSIDTAIEELLPSGPKAVGMRTLSNQHPNYNPNYSLHDHTGGHNYHNGPEWPWLTGFFLLSVKRLMIANSQYQLVYDNLVDKVNRHVNMNPYNGIVELTNKDGEWCVHSCVTQAWSMACLREAIQ